MEIPKMVFMEIPKMVFMETPKMVFMEKLTRSGTRDEKLK